MSQLRVLFVAAECAPYSKSGGLGDVVGALPRYLRRRGIDARVMVPLHAGSDWNALDVLEGPGTPFRKGTLEVATGSGRIGAGVRMSLPSHPDREAPVYFIEHHRYFDRRGLYGPPGGAYGDNLERFSFLSLAALELSRRLAFVPDLVHAHDWHAALAPVYQRGLARHDPLAAAASVFTIHNLAHQGVFGHDRWPLLGLPPERWGDLEHRGALNLMKGGILQATTVSTVSPTYAAEILTPEHGLGLDAALRHRADHFRGILNGIDTELWNPAHDPHLAATYDAAHMEGKARCKAALQQEAGLPVRSDLPLFGSVGRLTAQKGIDLLADCLEELLALDLQLVLLGTGDPALEERLRHFAARRGDRFRLWLEFDEGRAHRIEAGADFFIMPSRFEPCGLNQLYSMRYGTLPIVHATGGLADTVDNLDEATGSGTGFVLYDLGTRSLYATLGWAVATWYQRPEAIRTMRGEAMARDFSWERAAAEYEQLYRQAVGVSADRR